MLFCFRNCSVNFFEDSFDSLFKKYSGIFMEKIFDNYITKFSFSLNSSISAYFLEVFWATRLKISQTIVLEILSTICFFFGNFFINCSGHFFENFSEYFFGNSWVSYRICYLNFLRNYWRNCWYPKVLSKEFHKGLRIN